MQARMVQFVAVLAHNRVLEVLEITFEAVSESPHVPDLRVSTCLAAFSDANILGCSSSMTDCTGEISKNSLGDLGYFSSEASASWILQQDIRLVPYLGLRSQV
jgi:hypothetical protein